jgi:hypothetical protein
MNIRKHIREELDSFGWTDSIHPLGEAKEGEVFFIVDSDNPGSKSNKDQLRFIVKLGEIYTAQGPGYENIGYIKMFEADRMGSLEFYREGDDLDLSKIDWYEDDGDDDITVEKAEELIRNGYWRPWSTRGKDVEINESNGFEWAEDTPEGYDIYERKRAVEFGPILKKVFEDTRFSVGVDGPVMGIIDETGIYLDWDVNEVLTMKSIINQFRSEVDISESDELREEYREVYMLLLDYFGEER